MITIQVCVGSSCFLRGSKDVILEIERLLAQHQLKNKVLLKGSFCLGQCANGISVMVGEKLITGMDKEGVHSLLEQEILPALEGDEMK